MPKFPGSDPDHFDHWAHDDPKNQELLNGAYWKYMKKDGITDRLTPATGILSLSLSLSLYIHTRIHACMHACIHTYMHACMYTHIHTAPIAST